MKKTSETIVFFGSGPVAAKALKLLANDFEIEAVVTKPQPTHHKDNFPVLSLSDQLGLKTLLVSNRDELANLFKNNPVKSRVGLVIDFGVIIPKEVINYFELGIVNSHFSLLPQWRGADPITFAILSGQRETGVSLMLIVEKLDEGPLLEHALYSISRSHTTPELTDALIELSHELIIYTLPSYIEGKVKPYPQDSSITPTYSRKLTKQDGVIDWTKPAHQLEREIRAFIGWPGSRTVLADKEITITSAVVVDADGKPGDIKVDGKRIIICCGEHALEILRLKPAGKKEMSAEAFLAGHKNLLK